MGASGGHEGAIYSSTKQIGGLNTYSLNVNNGTLDVTSFGSNWKEYIDGVKDFSGSASGYLDYSDAMQKEIVDKILSSSESTLTLDFKVTKDLTLTGSVKISSLSANLSVTDKVGIAFNFVGNGALTVKVGS